MAHFTKCMLVCIPSLGYRDKCQIPSKGILWSMIKNRGGI
jgi:hypothetical protein